MFSPFISKLGTNYPATDEEVVEIEKIIVEPGLRFRLLDKEIAQLQMALDKLKAERDTLSDFVDGHEALISPFRRLPLNVVQEIFLACLPAHGYCVMSASEAPVLLGRICSSLRSLSLSTSRLWSKLRIVEPTVSSETRSLTWSKSEEKVAQLAQGIRMWLGRSSQCPLSISLDPAWQRAGYIPAIENLILEVIVSFAPGWEHLAFTGHHSNLAPMSYLEDLSIPIGLTEGIFLQVLVRCPQLRTCKLDITGIPDKHSSK
jgi:hypothetical protein